MTRLEVRADLTVEVDGVPATLTGDGGRLVLATEDPGRLWSAVTGAGLPAGVGRVAGARAIGRLADGLRDAGVQVDVTGPGGSLVAIGADVRSVAGRLTTGSSAVRPGAVRALAPLVVSDVRRRTGALKLAVPAAIGLALAVTAIRRRTC